MRKLLLAAVVLSISCTERLCGCTPPPELAVVRGTLQNAEGDPLPGKRVRAEMANLECTTYTDALSADVSDLDGEVLLSIYGFSRDSVCVRLFARDTTAGAMESPVGSVFKVLPKLFPYDTVDVPMVLAPVAR